MELNQDLIKIIEKKLKSKSWRLEKIKGTISTLYTFTIFDKISVEEIIGQSPAELRDKIIKKLK